MSLKNIIVVLGIFSLLVFPQRMDSAQLEIKVLTLDDHLQQIFGDKAPLMKAVFIHESVGLKLDAKGYNCHYFRKDGTRYSSSCKKEDRVKAWSVDCGLGQVNVIGQVCPAHLLTLEGNMKAVEKIYKEQGLGAWVSYKSGAYKKYYNG